MKLIIFWMEKKNSFARLLKLLNFFIVFLWKNLEIEKIYWETGFNQSPNKSGLKSFFYLKKNYKKCDFFSNADIFFAVHSGGFEVKKSLIFSFSWQNDDEENFISILCFFRLLSCLVSYAYKLRMRISFFLTFSLHWKFLFW